MFAAVGTGAGRARGCAGDGAAAQQAARGEAGGAAVPPARRSQVLRRRHPVRPCALTSLKLASGLHADGLLVPHFVLLGWCSWYRCSTKPTCKAALPLIPGACSLIMSVPLLKWCGGLSGRLVIPRSTLHAVVLRLVSEIGASCAAGCLTRCVM